MFFARQRILKIFDGKGLYSKFPIHIHIIIMSGASKSPLLVFYVNDVLNAAIPNDAARTPEIQYLKEVLRESLKKSENWLVTTEINFGGVVRIAPSPSIAAQTYPLKFI